MARGELVLRRGARLTSRETGVLAAVGLGAVEVVRRPRVAIVSTGDELVAPGAPSRPAAVYDSNATMLADAVRELGGEPFPLGIVGDDAAALNEALDRGLARCDLVVMSGGTSKGAGDVSYRVLAGRSPGVVVPRGRPQAGKAGLPRGGRDVAGGDPAGLPDLGRLHLPRVRRPARPPARRGEGPTAARR